MIAAAPERPHVAVEIRGAPRRLFREQPPEVVIAGAAGTGKTRAILEWIHRRCATERIRVLFLRKTLESLKGSALLTYTDQVLHGFDGRLSPADGVDYFGGNRIKLPKFTYAETGSTIVLGGMDKTSKILSTEYDLIYVNECTELTVDEWEQLGGRTDRPSIHKRSHGVLIGDCNPDAPTHWIKQREADGVLALWSSRHEHNPAMWDKDLKQWTDAGLRYLARIDRYTGVRYQRMRLGKWVAAEGQVYEGWNPDIHLVHSFDIPHEWPRYWVIDFGYVHPFVWQWWAEGPDGVLYRYREIYMTRRLVEDHANIGMSLMGNEPRPTAVITDHDAEDRATFERKTGFRTNAAHKGVSDGIQAVAERLRPTNGKPRIVFLRDSLVERDRNLAESGAPTCTEEEFTSYVWNTTANRRKGEEPMKEHDHGMDTTRYLVAHFDLKRKPGKMVGV
jgi:PBSX family phage terminase large subunit